MLTFCNRGESGHFRIRSLETGGRMRVKRLVFMACQSLSARLPAASLLRVCGLLEILRYKIETVKF